MHCCYHPARALHMAFFLGDKKKEKRKKREKIDLGSKGVREHK